jgi:hypothetical protein
MSLPLFASVVTLGTVLVLILDPFYGPAANAAEAMSTGGGDSTQSITAGQYTLGAHRDAYGVTNPVAAAAGVPTAGIPDPGSAKAIAFAMVQHIGWPVSEYNCLVALWERESHWNVFAANPSGAYGIPQALPGSKMASAGPNWQSNASTQISWGLGYIKGRYKTPCGAWAHSQSSGWY